jgi:hypothetical protein
LKHILVRYCLNLEFVLRILQIFQWTFWIFIWKPKVNAWSNRSLLVSNVHFVFICLWWVTLFWICQLKIGCALKLLSWVIFPLFW